MSASVRDWWAAWLAPATFCETSLVPAAACCTLRAISRVAESCCSTAAAIVVAMPLISRMVSLMPPIAVTQSPVADWIGQPEAGDLLQARIHRVLAVARVYGYRALVLGAWGCGAFGNDPVRTATDFRSALEGEFAGVFEEVVVAISDWSPERKFPGPFRDVFAAIPTSPAAQ